MSSPPRTEAAGAIHHVWARGAVKQTIFIDDRDRRRYLFSFFGSMGGDPRRLYLEYVAADSKVRLNGLAV
jgi:hypothetical protein